HGGKDSRSTTGHPSRRRPCGEPGSAPGIQYRCVRIPRFDPLMSRARREHPAFIRAWASREPGQLLGKGHPAGDFLQAHEWKVLEERQGFLKIRAHLPHHVRNPRGQLFGVFTPTYVDLLALFTVRAGEPRMEERFRTWLATTNMR